MQALPRSPSSSSRQAVGRLVTIVLLLLARPAHAFVAHGHEVIEAQAYLQLIQAPAVTLTDGRVVRGADVLWKLIASRLLEEPECTDTAAANPTSRRHHACRALADRGDVTLFPPLRTGDADMVLARQTSDMGQCFHFMADRRDLDQVESTFGTHRGAVAPAYQRCVNRLGDLLRAAMHDPAGEMKAFRGLYAAMHAIGDSFSDAHAARDAAAKVSYLKPWRLLTWDLSSKNEDVRRLFFTEKYHAAFYEPRDDGYLEQQRSVRVEHGTPMGQAAEVPCTTLAVQHPYFVPRECLSPAATRAVAALVRFLTVVYEYVETNDPDLNNGRAWTSFVSDFFGAPVVEQRLPAEYPISGYSVVGGLAVQHRATPRLQLGLEHWNELSPPFVIGHSFLLNLWRNDVAPESGPLTASARTQVGTGYQLDVSVPVAEWLVLGVVPIYIEGAVSGETEWSTDWGTVLGRVNLVLWRRLGLVLTGPHWSLRNSTFRTGPYAALWLSWRFNTPRGGRLLPGYDARDSSPFNWPPPGRPRFVDTRSTSLVLGTSYGTPSTTRSRYSIKLGLEMDNSMRPDGSSRKLYLGVGGYLGMLSTSDKAYGMMQASIGYVRWRPVPLFSLGLEPLILQGSLHPSSGELLGDLSGDVTAALVIGGKLQLRLHSPRLSYFGAQRVFNREWFSVDVAWPW